MPTDHATALRLLQRAWSQLALSTTATDRFSFWDRIIVTAAGPAQASLYEAQLERCRRNGFLRPDCRTMVVPDPDGRRIGSGGATIAALSAADDGTLEQERVLLIHAGGDSKRLPWANAIGKAFVPLPIDDDPDRPVPNLLDHLLALSAPLAHRLDNGLLILTGDVLPLVDTAHLAMTPHDAVVVTTPVTTDLAVRHGVIVGNDDGTIRRLLQKPDLDSLRSADALIAGSAALLDTGIFLYRGDAWRHMVAACRKLAAPAIAHLSSSDDEWSLYEEMAHAQVPFHHDTLANRHLGQDLLEALCAITLHHHQADDLAFWHFGTSLETLQHLTAIHGIGRQLAFESQVDERARIGADGLAITCQLGPGMRFGDRCIAMGLAASDMAMQVPPRTALWQLPLHGQRDVLVAVGIDDDPKTDHSLLGRPMDAWLADRDLTATDVWPDDEPRVLWHARLFPTGHAGLLGGLIPYLWDADPARRSTWLSAERLSLADLHANTDFTALLERLDGIRSSAALASIDRLMTRGSDRDPTHLGRVLTDTDRANLITLPPAGSWLPASRQAQLTDDIHALHQLTPGNIIPRSTTAFQTLREETARAMGVVTEPVATLAAGEHSCALPIRIDLAGGWSDTPPWCLEREAAVLNIAVSLDGALPITATASATAGTGILHLNDERGTHPPISLDVLAGPVDLSSPYALVQAALQATGYTAGHLSDHDIHVQTAARIPRGSGLGGSSILAAAVVTVLQGLAGRCDHPDTVSRLVLGVEQRMGTGGGWQDQVGGLYPGVKCATSVPGHPLRLQVDPVALLPAVSERLHQRLVIIDTGIQRLAADVLQIIVTRYLRRDRTVMQCIARLADLALSARDLLALGDLDQLGLLLDEVWGIHQQLDPHCSNPAVDDLFARLQPHIIGGKLTGAGGGGFLIAMAHSTEGVAAISAEVGKWQQAKLHSWAIAD